MPALRLLPAALLAGLAACSGRPSAPGPAPEAPPPFLLARHPEALVQLELPQDSRGGIEPPERVPVRGPFRLVRSAEGVHSFEAPLPVRPRVLFFSSAPRGMEVYVGDEKLRFSRGPSAATRDRSWSFSATRLELRLETDEPPAHVWLRYPKATERERSLNLRWAGTEGELDFALRSLQQGPVTRTGVLLPAPGRATWKLELPAGAVLAVDAGLLEPETADLPPSDGALLAVELRDAAGELHRLAAWELDEPGAFRERRVSLADYGGQEVALSLVSEPGGDPRYDYVFAGEPTVYVPEEHPRRIALVFPDTLRRDHLGVYGYARETTPFLDRWAREATVYEDARALAPWTLPSVRALLTGGQPEYWGRLPTVAQRLARAGWTTACFVGNVYLSANFDMADGWSHHFIENWPRAGDQVDRALDWLDAHDDRPVLLLVHFMDTHLPYTEPARYRHLYAGTAPEGLRGAFQRSTVIRAARGAEGERARQYVQDRYDGSIRYLDDQLARLLPRFDPEDAVFFFSDHGEEFWDHGGFEHGHTLYDELLRVPLLVRAPGFPPGRVEARATLADLAPSVLRAAGLPQPEDPRFWGRPLQDLDPDAPPRDLAFGRPLYGHEQWGVLVGDEKYTTKAGRESLYDLDRDPGEHKDLARGQPGRLPAFREALGRALGDWPSGVVLRLVPSRGPRRDIRVELDVPGGIRAAWVGNDATLKSEATVEVEGETARISWEGHHSGTREVFVAPARPVEEVLDGLVLRELGPTGREARVQGRALESRPDGHPHTLARLRTAGQSVLLTYAVAPEPPAEGEAVEGYDSESAAALKALGYLE